MGRDEVLFCPSLSLSFGGRFFNQAELFSLILFGFKPNKIKLVAVARFRSGSQRKKFVKNNPCLHFVVHDDDGGGVTDHHHRGGGGDEDVAVETNTVHLLKKKSTPLDKGKKWKPPQKY